MFVYVHVQCVCVCVCTCVCVCMYAYTCNTDKTHTRFTLVSIASLCAMVEEQVNLNPKPATPKKTHT